MKTKFTGQMTIAGKTYDIQVLDEVRYVKYGEEWITIKEFARTLPPAEIMKFATVGAMAVDAERRGETIPVVDIYRNFNKPTN